MAGEGAEVKGSDAREVAAVVRRLALAIEFPNASDLTIAATGARCAQFA
jgi:hypothetical protein